MESKNDILKAIADQCDIEVSAIEDAYPCTAFQAASFAATVSVPGLLVSSWPYKLNAPVSNDLERFKRSIQWAYDRNSILRTRIVKLECDGQEPKHIQAIVRQPLVWELFDDVHAYTAAAVGREMKYGDPVVHFAISSSRDYFVWTMHHALYDAYSLGLLWNDIIEAWKAGSNLPQPTPRPTFSKYIAFQKKGPSSETFKFWRNQLADYKGPSLKILQSNSQNEPIYPETNKRCNGMIGIEWPLDAEIIVASRIRCAWACTMMEYFKTYDIMFLTVMTGRNVPVFGVDQISGPTIQSLPVRIRGNSDMTVRDFLRDIQTQSIEMMEHEIFPRKLYEEQVVEERRPRHTLNIITGNVEGASVFEPPISGLIYAPDTSKCPRIISEWAMDTRVYDHALVWTLFADSKKIPLDGIEFMSRRFEELVKEGLKEEFLARRLGEVLHVGNCSY